jgi:biotin carboxyl carrier protein
MKYTVKIRERQFTVEIADLSARPIRATVDGETFEVWPESATDRDADKRILTDTAAPASVPSPLRIVTAPAPRPQAPVTSSILAPLPGVIVSVSVRPGEAVSAGQEMCVLEAMKMKSPIRAPRAGTVGAVHVAVGQQVRHKEVLVDYAD